MTNLVIDIGNTNSKLAVFQQGDMLHYKRVRNVTEPEIARLIKDFKVENATISSVGISTAELEDFLKRSVNFVPFNTSVRGEIENHYQTLDTLGLDRWAKVIAAHRLFRGQNCLLVDAGTCITYDILNSTNEYFGGSISLGIKMRFEALNHFTERLPLIAWEGIDHIPAGSNTTNAIKNGVLQGVLNEVKGFISSANETHKALKVFITGGDADFLTKQLKNSIFATQIIHEPYLVLKGLNEVITLQYVQ